MTDKETAEALAGLVLHGGFTVTMQDEWSHGGMGHKETTCWSRQYLVDGEVAPAGHAVMQGGCYLSIRAHGQIVNDIVEILESPIRDRKRVWSCTKEETSHHYRGGDSDE